MPPRGGRPGGGFGPGGVPGGFGGGGFFGHDFTMRDAHSAYDARRTLGRPMPVGGQHGYIPSGNSFSFIDVYHKIKLAQHYSLHSNGASRIRSFIGNYQYLTHHVDKDSRFTSITTKLDKALKEKEITPEVYASRIMYEAVHYYGYMRKKTVISEEEYRSLVTEFADSKGIDFDFGDEAPARTR